MSKERRASANCTALERRGGPGLSAVAGKCFFVSWIQAEGLYLIPARLEGRASAFPSGVVRESSVYAFGTMEKMLHDLAIHGLVSVDRFP